MLAVTGVVGAVVATAADHSAAGSAAAQAWPPFVLVTGLLLVGMVADGEGLFAAAGRSLARPGRGGVAFFAGAMVLVAVVTSILNLDTSVAFLTPVFVHAARRRGQQEAALLYGSLLVANAASLLLPGSNLTNLIVLGHVPMAGGAFFHRVAPAWVVAVVVTATVVAVVERRSLPPAAPAEPTPRGTVSGIGLVPVVAVVAVTVLVVTLRSPALPVAVVGVTAVAVEVAAGRKDPRRVAGVLGLPVLIGLFGAAVALGTVGRAWSGPATLLAHLDAWETAAAGALASVTVNNLPAAALLAARTPHRPLALLVGLDIGPNLLATGSLSWILWRRAAEGAGARPSLRRAGLNGLVSAPLAMAGALAVLALVGSR